MNSIRLSKDFLNSSIVLIGFLSYIFYLITGSFIGLSIFCSLGLLSFITLKVINVNIIFYIFLTFSSLTFLLFGYNSPNFDFGELILSLIYFWVGIGYALILFFEKNKLLVIKVVYILFLIYLFFKISILGYTSIDLFNYIFHSGSRNVVGAFIIFILFIIIILSVLDNKKVNFIYYLSCFIFCVLLYGRSGIIISAVMLLYALSGFLKINKYRSLIVFSALIFLYLYFIEDVAVYLMESTNISRGLESPRSIIFSEYISNSMTFKEFLFGRKIEYCCQYAMNFAGNLHNSFLYAHSKFGIVSIIYFLLSIMVVLLTKRVIFIFIFMLICIRYFYDELGYFGFYDIPFYLIVIYFLNKMGVISKK